MAAILVFSGVIFGTVVFTLTFLFEQYPAAQIDWNSLKFYMRLAQLVAGALICAGVGLALWKKLESRRAKIAYVSLAIAIVGAFLILRSNKELPQAAKASIPQRYEFTTDWVTRDERNWEKLLAHLKGKPNVQALEIGSYEGRSAIWFLESVLTDESASITCIDIFNTPAIEARFDRNIAASGLSQKVTKLKARSDDALKQVNSNTFDFVYVDGSHMAKDVLVDAVLAWEAVKPDGIIIFDDYEWTGRRNTRFGRHRTPKIALNAFLNVYGPYVDVLHKGYQVIVRKRSSVDVDDDGKLGQVVRRIQLMLL